MDRCSNVASAVILRNVHQLFLFMLFESADGLFITIIIINR